MERMTTRSAELRSQICAIAARNAARPRLPKSASAGPASATAAETRGFRSSRRPRSSANSAFGTAVRPMGGGGGLGGGLGGGGLGGAGGGLGDR